MHVQNPSSAADPPASSAAAENPPAGDTWTSKKKKITFVQDVEEFVQSYGDEEAEAEDYGELADQEYEEIEEDEVN